GDQRHVEEALHGSQIAQVTDPYLIGSFQLLALDPIAKYRQVMVGLRRMRVWRRHRLQQQIASPQFLEHPVPSHPHPSPLQFGLEHMVELAGPKSRLELPFLPYQLGYQLTVHSPALPHFAPRIVVLPRHAQPLAYRGDIDPVSSALPWPL